MPAISKAEPFATLENSPLKEPGLGRLRRLASDIAPFQMVGLGSRHTDKAFLCRPRGIYYPGAETQPLKGRRPSRVTWSLFQIVFPFWEVETSIG